MQFCSILLNTVGVQKGHWHRFDKLNDWITHAVTFRMDEASYSTGNCEQRSSRPNYTKAELEIRSINRCRKELVVLKNPERLDSASILISQVLYHLAMVRIVFTVPKRYRTYVDILDDSTLISHLDQYGNEKTADIWRRTESCSGVGSV